MQSSVHLYGRIIRGLVPLFVLCLLAAACSKIQPVPEPDPNEQTEPNVDPTPEPEPEPEPEPDPEPEPEPERLWVDLGLPSGLKWAECNIGADAPEAYGQYFAWGETVPKEVYSWTNYAFATSGNDWDNVKFSKYITAEDYGPADNLTALDAADDAAAVAWGDGWRMPTDADFAELKKNCTSEWTEVNGVYGRRFTGKSNGASIFLPAAGFYSDSGLNNSGASGYYWTSTLYRMLPFSANGLFFSSAGVYPGYDYRCFGRPVRPVTR